MVREKEDRMMWGTKKDGKRYGKEEEKNVCVLHYVAFGHLKIHCMRALIVITGM